MAKKVTSADLRNKIEKAEDNLKRLKAKETEAKAKREAAEQHLIVLNAEYVTAKMTEQNISFEDFEAWASSQSPKVREGGNE